MEINRPKIFISHSWEDKPFVQRLETILMSGGADVWVDHSATRGGDNLPERISEALDWCDTFLLIWSEAAANSNWVKLEWTNAISLGKGIIPCLLGKNKLPAILANKIYIDFRDYEPGIIQLLRTLKIGKQIMAEFAFEKQMAAANSSYSVSQDDVNEISKIFLTRDKAVSNKNRKNFPETQLNNKEITWGSSRGYIDCSKLTSSILKIVQLDLEFHIEYVALVNEDYEHDDQYTHSAYIIYSLIKTNDGLKIIALKSLKLYDH